MPLHDHTPEAIRKRLARPAKGTHLRDAVYGGIDGAVTTLAIVTGVAGAGLSHGVVLALGTANVLADGFSMAAGNFVATRAERENLERLRAMEAEHIQRYPEGERLEVKTILENKGLGGSPLEQAVASLTSLERPWIDMMLAEEHGVTTVSPRPLHGALITFAAFIGCGLVPLAPFLLRSSHPLVLSLIMTLSTFALIGAARSHWSLRAWWYSAIETLAIGSIAGGVAWIASLMVSRMVAL